MSRKEVRRDNPPALFLCPPLSSRTRCGHQVIPHPDAGFRDTDKITRKIHFSGPRITCGVTPFVMPPSMRSPSHPVPRCGIQRIPSSVIPSSNAAPWSCRLRCGHQVIPHPMRDPGMPAVYTAGNRPDSRDARPVRPESPLFFSRKRKGKPKESSRLMSES